MPNPNNNDNEAEEPRLPTDIARDAAYEALKKRKDAFIDAFDGADGVFALKKDIEEIRKKSPVTVEKLFSKEEHVKLRMIQVHSFSFLHIRSEIEVLLQSIHTLGQACEGIDPEDASPGEKKTLEAYENAVSLFNTLLVQQEYESKSTKPIDYLTLLQKDLGVLKKLKGKMLKSPRLQEAIQSQKNEKLEKEAKYKELQAAQQKEAAENKKIAAEKQALLENIEKETMPAENIMVKIRANEFEKDKTKGKLLKPFRKKDQSESKAEAEEYELVNAYALLEHAHAVLHQNNTHLSNEQLQKKLETYQKAKSQYEQVLKKAEERQDVRELFNKTLDYLSLLGHKTLEESFSIDKQLKLEAMIKDFIQEQEKFSKKGATTFQGVKKLGALLSKEFGEGHHNPVAIAIQHFLESPLMKECKDIKKKNTYTEHELEILKKAQKQMEAVIKSTEQINDEVILPIKTLTQKNMRVISATLKKTDDVYDDVYLTPKDEEKHAFHVTREALEQELLSLENLKPDYVQLQDKFIALLQKVEKLYENIQTVRDSNKYQIEQLAEQKLEELRQATHFFTRAKDEDEGLFPGDIRDSFAEARASAEKQWERITAEITAEKETALLENREPKEKNRKVKFEAQKYPFLMREMILFDVTVLETLDKDLKELKDERANIKKELQVFKESKAVKAFKELKKELLTTAETKEEKNQKSEKELMKDLKKNEEAIVAHIKKIKEAGADVLHRHSLWKNPLVVPFIKQVVSGEGIEPPLALFEQDSLMSEALESIYTLYPEELISTLSDLDFKPLTPAMRDRLETFFYAHESQIDATFSEDSTPLKLNIWLHKEIHKMPEKELNGYLPLLDDLEKAYAVFLLMKDFNIDAGRALGLAAQNTTIINTLCEFCGRDALKTGILTEANITGIIKISDIQTAAKIALSDALKDAMRSYKDDRVNKGKAVLTLMKQIAYSPELTEAITANCQPENPDSSSMLHLYLLVSNIPEEEETEILSFLKQHLSLQENQPADGKYKKIIVDNFKAAELELKTRDRAHLADFRKEVFAKLTPILTLLQLSDIQEPEGIVVSEYIKQQLSLLPGLEPNELDRKLLLIYVQAAESARDKSQPWASYQEQLFKNVKLLKEYKGDKKQLLHTLEKLQSTFDSAIKAELSEQHVKPVNITLLKNEQLELFNIFIGPEPIWSNKVKASTKAVERAFPDKRGFLQRIADAIAEFIANPLDYLHLSRKEREPGKNLADIYKNVGLFRRFKKELNEISKEPEMVNKSGPRPGD